MEEGAFVYVLSHRNAARGQVLGSIASDGKNTIMMFGDWQTDQEYSARRDVIGATPNEVNSTTWKLKDYYLLHISDEYEVKNNDDYDEYSAMLKSRKRKGFKFNEAQSWLNDRLINIEDYTNSP